MLRDKVRDLAGRVHGEVIAHRRHLHRYPELSFAEEKTGRYIQHVLEKLDVPFSTGWAGHGIVASIESGDPAASLIFLRADMDALPIQELNDVEYKSVHDGVMHACGHDVHTSALLGAVAILASLRGEFSGTVRCIFQPGEEKLPGGASVMIREGLFGDGKPGIILGQHVHPQLPAGTVGFCPGASMGSADEITITVKGRGGHGAMPHLTVDPVAVSAQIITALQQVVSRIADPIIPSVLTFGKIASDGGAFNVIPDKVVFNGTFRTFNEEWRAKAHEKIVSIAHGVSAAFGANCDVDISRGYPVLMNDIALTARCQSAASEYLGQENVQEIPPRLTAEDFAYYTQEMPGCFYRLGVANEARGITASVHTAQFDIDEEALQTGAGLMAWLALHELAKPGQI